jgi:hypothetical protein
VVASSTYLVVERGESRDEEALENVFVIPIDRHFGDSTLEDSGRSCSVDQDVVECPCQRIGVVECPTIEIATADCPRYTWGKVKATSKNGGPQLSPLPFSAFTPLA